MPGITSHVQVDAGVIMYVAETQAEHFPAPEATAESQYQDHLADVRLDRVGAKLQLLLEPIETAKIFVDRYHGCVDRHQGPTFAEGVSRIRQRLDLVGANQMVMEQPKSARDALDWIPGLGRVKDHPVGLVEFAKLELADIFGSKVAQEPWCCKQERFGKLLEPNADLHVFWRHRQRSVSSDIEN